MSWTIISTQRAKVSDRTIRRDLETLAKSSVTTNTRFRSKK
ncbi:MAG: DeoR family transcriptional regulator [bacterium]|nr:DeoR family transcriptional regulator [bacterium]